MSERDQPTLSCRLEVLPGETLNDKLANAERFGFDAVSFPGRHFANFADELKTLKNTPVQFAALSLGFEGSLLSPSAETRRKCRDSLLHLFDFCSEVGIPRFNMPPILNQDNPDRISDPGEFASLGDRLDNMLVEQLPEIGDRARERGVTLCLEPVNRYESDYLNSVGHAAELCTRINHSNIGLTADFFHMRMEELSVPRALAAAGEHLRLVHVAENTRVEPGPGSMDFVPGFNTLANLAYVDPIEVECRTLSGSPFDVLPKCVEYLRSLLTRTYD